jgi:ADP-ribosylglycohydrolase
MAIALCLNEVNTTISNSGAIVMPSWGCWRVDERYADRVAGVLYGTALGDALGLYVEGLKAEVIARRFGRIDRFHMPGGIGLLSDDTEHTALIAESLALYPDDAASFQRHLRWCLVKWFWSLPPGIGMATAKACLRMTVGLPSPGVRSAGNGSAMRAAVIGVVLHARPEARREFGIKASTLTHTDERATAGAMFVAELAAECIRVVTTLPQVSAYEGGSDHATTRRAAFDEALADDSCAPMRKKLERARELALAEASTQEAARVLGTTGFVMHTVPFAAFCFLRFGDNPMEALSECISAGGDTDSIAAILGAWLGALHGRSALNAELIDRLLLGPIDLQGLNNALLNQGSFKRFNYPVALAKNLVSLPYLLTVAVCRWFY